MATTVEKIAQEAAELTRQERLTLVRLLLGRGGTPREEAVSWRCPIAGGQRTITIESLSEQDAPNGSPAPR